MGEEDVEAGRLRGEGEAEVADPGAGIEGQQRSVGEGDADAGGVAAVADRVGPRGRDRASRAPELELHLSARPRSTEVGQKTAIAPWVPCGVRIGKAEASTLWRWPSVERISKVACAGRSFRTATTSGSSS